MATTMDNEKLYTRLLIKFRDSQGDFANLFAAARSDPDHTAAARAAHTLKGTAGNIGAKGVQAAAAELEHAYLVNATPEQIDALLANALNELQPVIKGLRAVVNKCLQNVGSGGLIGLDVLRKRVDSHVRDLRFHVPALKQLRASQMKLQQQSSHAGLSLEVYLQEVPQMALPFPIEKSARSVMTDIFLQELSFVQSQLSSIPHKALWAISPAMNPADDVQIQAIRKRIKMGRRQQEFLIQSGLDADRLTRDQIPKCLPRGFSATTRVRVNCLHPKKAEVTVRAVLQHQEGDGSFGLRPNTKIDLLRVGIHLRPETRQQLQQAMDTKHDITVRVTVAPSWATGQPQHLELVAIMDAVQVKTTAATPTEQSSEGSNI